MTHEITPFDELQKYLEETDRSTFEILRAVGIAISRALDMQSSEYNIEELIGEITGVALQYGIDPDDVLAIYVELQSKSE